MAWNDTKITGSTLTASEYNDLVNNVNLAATVTVGTSEQATYVTTDYGSDDLAIQAAIDYVAALTYGGSVYLTEGLYTIENTVNIKSNVKLYGAGKATQITFDSEDTMISCAAGTDLNNVIISDIYFHGTQTNAAHNEVGKTAYIINLISNCYDLTIERCYFDHSSNFGIGIGDGTYQDGKRVTIKNNFMYNCRAGIGTNCRNAIVSNNYLVQDLTTSSGEGIDINNVNSASSYFGTNDNMCIVSNNVVIGFPQDSIDTTDSEGTIVSNNYMLAKTTAHASGDPWIAINAGAYNVVSDNYIEGFVEGIRGQSHSTITGNVIKNVYNRGIEVPSMHQITISNNQILLIANTAAGRGINAYAFENGVISNNIIIDAGFIGIFVAMAVNLNIEGNILYCVTGAVSVSLIKGSITNSSFIGNSFVGNSHTSGWGITEFSTGVIISNNSFRNINLPIYTASTPELIINNVGYNPIGSFTAPAVPATTVNYTNAYGYPCQVQITGGTVTEIDIDDIATGLTSGVFIIPPGGTINITYSSVPTWRWWGL